MKAASVVLALGLAAALGGGAVTRAEGVPVTLAEALALAGKANPELQAAAARVEAQVARTKSVRRMRWPRLGLTMAWSRTDLPLPAHGVRGAEPVSIGVHQLVPHDDVPAQARRQRIN